MFNPLNQTKTVAYLVIALIVVVIVSTFFIKRTIVNKDGKEIGTETQSFLGKTFKKIKT
jgi:predicted ABC-type sugar transport system permease subunit